MKMSQCSALYGGLAQQEPSDPKGIMNRLRELAAKDPSVCYLGQYDNDDVRGFISLFQTVVAG